jgi:hypothetical protein
MGTSYKRELARLLGLKAQLIDYIDGEYVVQVQDPRRFTLRDIKQMLLREGHERKDPA